NPPLPPVPATLPPEMTISALPPLPPLPISPALTSAATGGAFTAQITRGDAEALALREGDTVY
uniref:hypothetical protein n=1 Tax=Mycobacterium tuberculosis TaxID=1773 RepID=UPI0035ABA84F